MHTCSFLGICVWMRTLTHVRVSMCVCNCSGPPELGPPQFPAGLWVVGRGFGFWLCLSLCADITVLMAPNPCSTARSTFYTKHKYKHTFSHMRTHGTSNANLAKKKRKKMRSLFDTHPDIHDAVMPSYRELFSRYLTLPSTCRFL